MQNDLSDVFAGKECFKNAFLLQIKDGAKPYQVLPRHVAYAPHELERLQDQQILTPLGVDETGE